MMLLMRHSSSSGRRCTAATVVYISTQRKAFHHRHLMNAGSRRSFAAAAAATSKQKRALDNAQLTGVTSSQPSTPGGTGATPNTMAHPGGPSNVSSSVGSNSGPVLAGVAGLAAVGGAYYYFNVMNNKKEAKNPAPAAPVKRDDPLPLPTAEDLGSSAPSAAIVSVSQKDNELQQQTVKKNANRMSGNNRVSNIAMPDKMRNKAASNQQASCEPHPVDGHRVTMHREQPPPVDDTSTTQQAIEDLQHETTQAASQALLESHQSLARKLDLQVVSDLDNLSKAQMQARIVQLVSELQDRTSWEAVRLKEFLAMKERDTADQYMQLIQKQRLELEDLMAQRLREQEHQLRSQLQQAVQEKEAQIQHVLQTAIEAQKQEHEQEKQTFVHSKRAELQAELEEEYGKMMEQLKTEMVADLEKKTAKLEQLTNTLHELQQALSASQTHQQGSAKAHKISAAALALAEKLETSAGAAPELLALQQAAGQDGVISTAVRTIPNVSAGVPTLSELQTRFAGVAKKCRQAALVPAGRLGLEGQLAGLLLSNLKFAPDADTPAPDADPQNAEFVVARARKHVALGELDKAVEELDKLSGQPAFTAADWKRDAMNRILVEKALKAIRMECALLNETLVSSSSPSSSEES